MKGNLCDAFSLLNLLSLLLYIWGSVCMCVVSQILFKAAHEGGKMLFHSSYCFLQPSAHVYYVCIPFSFTCTAHCRSMHSNSTL